MFHLEVETSGSCPSHSRKRHRKPTVRGHDLVCQAAAGAGGAACAATALGHHGAPEEKGGGSDGNELARGQMQDKQLVAAISTIQKPPRFSHRIGQPDAFDAHALRKGAE